jgi:hypothetical protein
MIFRVTTPYILYVVVIVSRNLHSRIVVAALTYWYVYSVVYWGLPVIVAEL